MRSKDTKSIEALLFDLGGVVIGIDFNLVFLKWAADAKVPVEAIQQRFSQDRYYEAHERGEISVDEYFASLRSSLKINLTDEQFMTGWNAIYLDEISETVQLIKTLEQQIPLYGFTNTNTAHQKVWTVRYRDALSAFQKIFVSSDMGMRKPDRDAFERISHEIGIPLDQILFFDDTLENIEGAKAVGMPAVHVQTPEDVKRHVETFIISNHEELC